MRALVVEDEARLARNVARALERHASFAVDVAHDGLAGLAMALAQPYDLLVLDLRLPGLGGLDLLQRLRTAGRRTPVLVLTALDGTDDVVQGLDRGADDYLTKPFELQELCARARALVRRSWDSPRPVLSVGGLEIDTVTRQVRWNGRVERLPRMEYRVLEYLASRPGRVVSKSELIDHVYDFESERLGNVIEVYVSSLRRRFGARIIETRRGFGYVLTGEPT